MRKNSDIVDRLLRATEAPISASSDFDLNPGIRPEGRHLKQAGVLVGVSLAGDEPRVILTKRSSHLKHHPGQIAFAGGKVDPGDGGSPERAALREAEEEIGLDRSLVQVVGSLPTHETVTRYQVTPVIGVIDRPFQAVAEAGEVEEVFSVPLFHVLDSDQFRIESRLWQGQRRKYFVIPFGPYYIWGATARILRLLAEGWNQ